MLRTAAKQSDKTYAVQPDAEEAVTEPGQVGSAVGDQTGVDTKAANPHTYVAAIVCGALAGLASIIVICVATYYVYKWNGEYAAAGKNPHCCLCCTPFVCCCPIDKDE